MLCLILSSNKGTPHLKGWGQVECGITKKGHDTHVEVTQSSKHTLIKAGLHDRGRVALSAGRDIRPLRGGDAVAPTGRRRGGGRFSHTKVDVRARSGRGGGRFGGEGGTGRDGDVWGVAGRDGDGGLRGMGLKGMGAVVIIGGSGRADDAVAVC